MERQREKQFKCDSLKLVFYSYKQVAQCNITCISSWETFSLLSFNWLFNSLMLDSRERTRSCAALRCAFCSCTWSCKFSWACLWLSDWFFSFSVSWVTYHTSKALIMKVTNDTTRMKKKPKCKHHKMLKYSRINYLNFFFKKNYSHFSKNK